jgi:hypothetical protein
MKNLLLAITIALAGCTAAEAATTEECCMNPLDEFTNSPRRWRNDDGSEVVSSSLTKLGPGLVASRPVGAPGETTFVLISVPQLAALEARVAALEAKEMVTVGPLSGTSHNAAPNTLVFVNMEDTGGPNDFTVSLPAPAPEIVNSRIRVVDVSADGGVGSGAALKISGTFAAVVSGGYLASPYVVANDGGGLSSRGAWIELVCRADGWLVAGESKQPMAP